MSRLGGDEFAILFLETNEDNAKTAIGNMHAELLRVTNGNNWPVTFSIGAVTCYRQFNVDELIKTADNLMYAVKSSGKNRVEYSTYTSST